MRFLGSPSHVAWALTGLAVVPLVRAQVNASDPGPDAAAGIHYSTASDTITTGRVLFATHCASCHALAHDGFGPPLGGITTLFAPSALLQRIREPARVIAAGDARANALLRRYKTVMPSFAHLRYDALAAILAYVQQESTTQRLTALVVDPSGAAENQPRLLPPVAPSGLAVELEDFVQLPRLPNRTAYQGIAFLRADPREAGALLVSDLMGIIYRVTNRQPAVFLDVRAWFPAFVDAPGVATGLGSFALHPGFVTNGIFYTTHAELRCDNPAINASDIPADAPPGPTPPLEWVVSEWRLGDPAAFSFAGTQREVLRFVTPTTAHGAQEIAFAPGTDPADPDYGMLYICIGDGGSINLKRPDMAGHPRTLLGAILRIDPAGNDGVNGRYGIPPDNPFAASKDPAVRQEIWAYGFRNPHRLSWDFTQGKRLLAVDIGEANVEEINLIEPGAAYGWGVGALEGTTHIDVLTDARIVRPATPAELAPYRQPFAQYDHDDGTAVTGGFVYTGRLEALRGKYIFGDIVNGRLFFLALDAAPADPTIYELTLVREGIVTGIKELAHAQRAHLRFGYDERTGDMFILTKDDGMVRRITAAYPR